MRKDVAELIGRATQPTGVTSLCERVKRLLQMSRDEMQKYYDQWDGNDMVYRGERKADFQDHQARKRGETEKITLPLTFGQVQTFVAFGHQLFNQKDYFYETVASGAEDEKPGRIAEATLERDLKWNKFRGPKLIAQLLDIARFGIGITKETWVRESVPVRREVVDQEAMMQVRQNGIALPQVPMKTIVEDKTTYLGNKIVNISPYRWFPDVRIPLSRWSEGEFCGDEIEESITKMKEMESQGLVAGIQHVPTLPNEAFSHRRLAFMRKDQAMAAPYSGNPHYYLLTEVQIRLNPAQTILDEGVALDPEIDREVIYIIWLLNDSRIVRIDEAGYNHERFGYNCAPLLDDQNRFINYSLCEILGACQDTATWLTNSHITSVRKNIFNQVVADPSGIEIDDVIKRSPVIRVKPGRAGSGVETWIKQLQVSDVTANHMNDVERLSSMAKEATGINETLLGQFSPGRRSAREASNVASYGASRLMMIFSSIWETALGPMGEKMLSNLRQGLDEQTMVTVYGELNTQEAMQPDLPGLPPPLYRLLPADRTSLVGNYDLAPFHGTLPSQRQATAAVLQQLVESMMKDPRVVLLTGLDPQLLFNEILALLNIRNVQRFKLTPDRLAQLSAMAGLAGNAGAVGNPQVGSGRPQGSPVAGNPAA